ncbi:MAG TPA: biotin/lipoyl-containing protein, partial [Dyella sp.]
LMLERLIPNGRHIEIQVFADRYGNAVHLGERDCSTQRRRQKVIEEAPSPMVSPDMRAAMGKDAVAAALAVGYQGAGTVEFIVDDELKHYFLEMNTRLQVEHPVTECITGFDLVEWQLRVAAGQPLTALIPGLQEDVVLRGHAIEARLYAEDPYDDFAPQAGRISWWRPHLASAQPGVRIDDGVREGDNVSTFYDPLLAKVIACGRDRDEAIRRLTAALEDAPLLGIRTNSRFLRDLVNHPSFKQAEITTTLLDTWREQKTPLFARPQPDDATWALAAAARVLRQGPGWRPDSVASYGMNLRCGDEVRNLQIRVLANGMVNIMQGGATQAIRVLDLGGENISYEIDGIRKRSALQDDGTTLQLAQHAACFAFEEPSPLASRDQGIDENQVRARLTGVVVQVAVREGDRVTANQPLVCVEAMKMEMWYGASTDGTVAGVHVQAGDPVESGVLLVELSSCEAA